MKSSFSREDLLLCSQGKLFGPESPRLPVDHMLMLDRITHISESGGRYEKGCITAELDITPEKWFFRDHFIGDPVMPGCLALDGMWQLMGFWLAWKGYPGRGRALGGNVRFVDQVLPDAKKIVYSVHINRLLDRKLLILTGEGSVLLNGEKEIYLFDGLKLTLLPSME